VFSREFQELVQGSKDSPAYHGPVTLSKCISKPRLLRFLRPQFAHKVVYYAAKKGFWISIGTNGRLLRQGRSLKDFDPPRGKLPASFLRRPPSPSDARSGHWHWELGPFISSCSFCRSCVRCSVLNSRCNSSRARATMW
jgi:hypothetical protein